MSYAAISTYSTDQEEDMNNFCTNCGTQLTPGAKFCPECGNEVQIRKKSAAPKAPKAGQAPAADTNATAAPKTAQPRQASKAAQPQQPRQQKQRPGSGSGTGPAAVRPSERGNYGAICILLSFVLAVEFCIAAWLRPGFLRKDPAGTGRPIAYGTTGTTARPAASAKDGSGSGSDSGTPAGEAFLEQLGLSRETIEEFEKNAPPVTPQNSPGNPAFIDVTFTQAEYDQARTFTAPVSRENPTADFPELGIHVDLKSWNLANAEDTLIVKQLPDKTDPVTGARLYTYDYSLASGQHRFYSDVAVTAPIQGDPAQFSGYVTFNEDTGAWEDVYYELSEDGRSFTAYSDHFTPQSQTSALHQLKEDATAAIDFYQADGKSFFVQLPQELNPKYENSSHYLFPVTVAETADLSAFISSNKDRKEYADMIHRLMQDGGGIPVESAFTSGLETLGFAGDVAGLAGEEVLEKVGKTFFKMPSGSLNSMGAVLTALGSCILALTVSEQAMKDVDTDKILKENKEGLYNAILGFVGTLAEYLSTAKWLVSLKVGEYAVGAATASVLGTSATVLSLIGFLIFSYTFSRDTIDSLTDAALPFGYPTSIVQGAYYEYLQHNAGSEYGYAKSLDPGLFYSGPNPADALDRTQVYEHTPEKLLAIDGTGWMEALKLLSEKYANDPVSLGSAIQDMYERYVNAFWLEPDEVRKHYFRRACKRYVNIEMRNNFGQTVFTLENAVDFRNTDPTIFSGSEEARQDYYDLQNYLIAKTKEMKNRNPNATMSAVWDTVFAEWDKDPAFEMHFFNKVDHTAWHDPVLEITKQKTNPIVYEYWRNLHRKSIMEVRDRLFNNVLPLLNTRLTFYAKDLAVDGSVSKDSVVYQSLFQSGVPAYTFEFTGDGVPLFLPGNAPYIQDFGWHLDLVQNKSNPVLLETTAYHYLMYGCPEDITIEEIQTGKVTGTYSAKADWDDVTLVKDETSGKIVSMMTKLESNRPVYAEIPPWEQEQYLKNSIEEMQKGIADTKIPVVFSIAPKDTGNIKPANLQSTDGAGLREIKGEHNFYGILINRALENATGSLKGNRFTISGSSSASYPSEGISGSGDASIQVSGEIDPETGKGTITVSGSAHYSGSSSSHWKEGDYSFRGSDHKNISWDFSGEGELSCGFKETDGSMTLKYISANVPVLMKKTGSGGGSTYMSGESGEWVHVGNSDSDHVTYDEKTMETLTIRIEPR